MPQGDGTGPRWAHGKWNCRRGIGGPAGPGRGFGRMRQQGEEDLDSLKSYYENLKSELNLVKGKIAALEKGSIK